MDRLQNLLTHVASLAKKNAELLDANGGRFNLFRIFGVDHYENTHSAILAELLNPKGSHGLKFILLECFFKSLGIDNKVDGFDYETSTVLTEYVIDGGRIDVFINDNQGHVVIIENKIFAQDQFEQLKRYQKYAKSKFGEGNFLILYLTLSGGREPSKHSGEGVDYTTVSYSDDIIKWLNNCVDLASRMPLVRESLIQYVNHLLILTNQDMNTKNTEEIVKLLTVGANLEAAFIIAQHMSAAKKFIVDKYFNDSLKEIAEKFHLDAYFLTSNHIYAGFGFFVPQWKYFQIHFEFDGNDYMKLGYMLKLKSHIVKCPDSTITALKPHFNRHNSNLGLPLGWSYMSKYSMWNVEAFQAILNGDMKAEIDKIVSLLLEYSNKSEL